MAKANTHWRTMWDYFLCLRLLCWSNNYKQRSSLHLHWFILRQKTYSLKSRCPYPSVWEKERGKYEKRLNDSLSNFTNLSSAILVFFCVCVWAAGWRQLRTRKCIILQVLLLDSLFSLVEFVCTCPQTSLMWTVYCEMTSMQRRRRDITHCL